MKSCAIKDLSITKIIKLIQNQLEVEPLYVINLIIMQGIGFAIFGHRMIRFKITGLFQMRICRIS